MPTYSLSPTPDTVHTFFSSELDPILTINDRDTVIFQTLDAGAGLEPLRADGSPRRVLQSNHAGPGGHALTGPVYVRGAKPGSTLGVRIDRLQPDAWGYTYAADPNDDSKRTAHRWYLDLASNYGRNQFGNLVRLAPFMGVLGVAPDEPGQHTTIPPRKWGGNLDCKLLGAGSTLYLPVGVEGALFSVGDGHALQGDGELSGTAIECPMKHVEITFFVLDDMPLTQPRAHTPGGWVTFGIHEDLNKAADDAGSDMLRLMQHQYQIEAQDALALASLVVDLHVTQIVNHHKGVHAVLPHGAIISADLVDDME